MGASNLSSSDISALIDHLLKSKDPATVGLRKILKNKKDKNEAYPLHPVEYEEFFVEGKSKSSLSMDETMIVEMQKRINDMQIKIENYEKDIPNREQAAYQNGINDGLKKGESDATVKCKAEYDAKIDELQKRINSFLANCESSRKDIFINAHNILLEFCFELSKKIIQTDVSCNPDIVLSTIKKALTYISDREKIIIRVSRDDLENVSGRTDFWIPVGERIDAVSIEPDDSIEKGGCIIESNSGKADARLGVQFLELREIIGRMWESVIASNTESENKAQADK
jgi:flagellar assembly protein FliH